MQVSMLLRFFSMIVISSVIQGCATISKTNPLPQNLESQVSMPGFNRDIRAWGDVRSDVLIQSAKESIVQEARANHGRLRPEVDALALSGGSQDGAFGAGLLCGWTASGKRPEFKLVTGISTGSLMAPFAFLGPSYDHILKKVYTSISDDDIYQPYSYVRLFLALIQMTTVTSVADNKPLAKLIDKLVDQKMLSAIAREHRKGRRLLVGTSEMYSQRLVIWNMGAIAASGSPQALPLFKKILLASSALPATFPPQMMEVMANGKLYDEMHVDGGVEVQVMLFENAIIPFSLQGKTLNGQRKVRRLYLIRNQSVHPTWENVKPKIGPIAIRAIDSLIKSQSIGDLYRIYTYTTRDNMEYNLAYVPTTYTQKPNAMFDKEYMTKLFNAGYRLGKNGYAWQHYPYGFDPAVKQS